MGNDWGWNPETIAVAINIVLLVGIGIAVWQAQIAVRQLKSGEDARRAQLLFHVWEKYEATTTLQEVRSLSEMLKKYPCSSLDEFNSSASRYKEEAGKSKEKKNFDADEARRLVKFMLAPLGYMLMFNIASEEELFPAVPAAIRLWGQGLREVEMQLLNHTGGMREYSLGYDPVYMVDFLYQRYMAKVDKTP